jgi:hypothetical protein
MGATMTILLEPEIIRAAGKPPLTPYESTPAAPDVTKPEESEEDDEKGG